MTTVVRPPSENDGDGRGRRIKEAHDELADRERDSEWVVDVASHRVVRREVPVPRPKR